jgi:hypothetical protein
LSRNASDTEIASIGFICTLAKHASCHDGCETSVLFLDECVGVARRFVDTKYGVDREILLTLSIAEAYKKC